MGLSHEFLEATLTLGAARLRFKEDVHFPWGIDPIEMDLREKF